MATSRNDPRVIAAVNGAMRAAYSKRGVVDRRGDFVWSVVYPDWAYKTGYAWCGGFMVWAYRQVGVDLMKCAWWFYTPYIFNFARLRGFLRGQSGYGWQPLFDWNRDGIVDHVGTANPDQNSSLFRSIEGNTSSGAAGSQSNGGGVWERYRALANIVGWVDMHSVLAWMIDTGKWDGKTSALPNPKNPALVNYNPNGYSAAYVRNVQQLLTSKGYSVGKSGIDGSLGADTYKAVVAYQKANGLDPDGIPGPKTLASLKTNASTERINVNMLPTLRAGSTGINVGRLQGLLLANGFSVGRYGVDRSWGADTTKAFRAFQAKHPATGTNGKPDGSCGPKSWKQLLGI